MGAVSIVFKIRAANTPLRNAGNSEFLGLSRPLAMPWF